MVACAALQYTNGNGKLDGDAMVMMTSMVDIGDDDGGEAWWQR